MKTGVDPKDTLAINSLNCLNAAVGSSIFDPNQPRFSISPTGSFLKSSSYLMFGQGFAKVRSFLLDHSQMIVQDDSGIPLANFNRAKWDLRLFGTYVGPIELFREYQQPGLREFFHTSEPQPFPIGFGYQFNREKSNLIVARRK